MWLNEDKVIHKIVFITGVHPTRVSVPDGVSAKDGRTFTITISIPVLTLDELHALERGFPFITSMHLSAIAKDDDGAPFIELALICDAELIPQVFLEESGWVK